MPRNPTWEPEELVLALELYCEIGKGDDKHPLVMALSQTLNKLRLDLARPDPYRFRNPNGVAMKLANFAALDPANAGVALSRGGRRDAEIWEKYAHQRGKLAADAQTIRATLLTGHESAEITEARREIAVRAGKRPGGQGFAVSLEARLIVEDYAMLLAEEHYRAESWMVKNVSANQSYDLCCQRPGSPDLHVEVKGTTTDGAEILLTPNEVAHARLQYPHVALFVVSQIALAQDATGELRASGGIARRYEPWQVDVGTLKALGYSYLLPPPTLQPS
jgi:hypothetical protein